MRGGGQRGTNKPWWRESPQISLLPLGSITLTQPCDHNFKKVQLCLQNWPLLNLCFLFCLYPSLTPLRLIFNSMGNFPFQNPKGQVLLQLTQGEVQRELDSHSSTWSLDWCTQEQDVSQTEWSTHRAYRGVHTKPHLSLSGMAYTSETISNNQALGYASDTACYSYADLKSSYFDRFLTYLVVVVL